MNWDANNPGGTGNGRRPHSGWMDQFLARTAERRAEMLDAIQDRLDRELAKLPEGQLPGKEFMRAARYAQDGFKHLADLQIEHAKLELLALRLTGKVQPMTDEEYQAKLEALGQDALDTQPAEKLEAALARRRALAASSEP